jgi:hypothetical protein
VHELRRTLHGPFKHPGKKSRGCTIVEIIIDHYNVQTQLEHCFIDSVILILFIVLIILLLFPIM